MINCYKYHGREDLLPAFSEEDEKANAIATANSNVSITITAVWAVLSLLTPVSPFGLWYDTSINMWDSLSLSISLSIHPSSIPRTQVEQIKIHNTNVITTTTSGSNSLASSSTNSGQQIVIQHQPQATITTSAAQHQTHQTIIKEASDGTLQIQQQNSPTQTLNAQVCLDSMALNDVDVRTNPFGYRNIDVVAFFSNYSA